MSNKTQLQTNNTKYASLIETLRGKAAGTSGEDVTEETTAYTTKISELETAVAALESELEGKASGSSGDGSVDTCTVNLSTSEGNIMRYIYTHCVNGEINSTYFQGSCTSVTLSDVVCGSFLYVGWSSSSVSAKQQYGLELLGNSYVYLHVTANAGETAILELYNPF